MFIAKVAGLWIKWFAIQVLARVLNYWCLLKLKTQATLRLSTHGYKCLGNTKSFLKWTSCTSCTLFVILSLHNWTAFLEDLAENSLYSTKNIILWRRKNRRPVCGCKHVGRPYYCVTEITTSKSFILADNTHTKSNSTCIKYCS